MLHSTFTNPKLYFKPAFVSSVLVLLSADYINNWLIVTVKDSSNLIDVSGIRHAFQKFAPYVIADVAIVLRESDFDCRTNCDGPFHCKFVTFLSASQLQRRPQNVKGC